MPDATCSVNGCMESPKGRGLCKRHYAADYYQRNRQSYIERAREWAATNPEARREHKQNHAPRARERAAEWRRDHPEAARESSAEHYRRNKALYRRRSLQWIRDNHERWLLTRRENQGRYRARLAGVGVTPTEFAEIIERDGMVCHICGMEIIGMNDLHFDHIVPLSAGGPHHQDNIAPTHAACNLSKGAAA